MTASTIWLLILTTLLLIQRTSQTPDVGLEKDVIQFLVDYFKFELDRLKACTILTYGFSGHFLSKLEKEIAARSSTANEHFPLVSYVHLNGPIVFEDFFDGWNPNKAEHNQYDMKTDSGCAVVLSTSTNPHLSDMFRLALPSEFLRTILIAANNTQLAPILNHIKDPGFIASTTLVLEQKKDLEDGFWVHTLCPFSQPMLKTNSWKKGRGLLFKTVPDCEGKDSLKGKFLTISISGVAPWVFYTHNPDDSPVQGISGIDVRITNSLARNFGFSFKFKRETYIGNILENGTWEGTTGSVKRFQSDMGVGTINVVYNRNKVVDFTSLVYMKELSMMTRKPVPVSPYNNIVYPLTGTVWLFMLIVSIIVSIVFYILYRGYLVLDKAINVNGIDRIETDVMDFILVTPSTVYQAVTMGWFKHMKHATGGSLLICVWLFSGMVVSEGYGGNLRASLMAVEYEKPIDSFMDLWKSGKRTWIVRGTSLVDSLGTSPFEAQRAVFHKALETGTTYRGRKFPDYVVADIVANGSAVTVAKGQYISTANKWFAAHGTQPFHKTKELWASLSSAFMLPKHSKERKQIISQAIRRLVEAGIIEKYYSEFSKIDLDRTSRSLADSTADKKLGLPHFLTIFVFWAVMLVLSCLTLLIEQIIAASKGWKRKKLRRHTKLFDEREGNMG